MSSSKEGLRTMTISAEGISNCLDSSSTITFLQLSEPAKFVISAPENFTTKSPLRFFGCSIPKFNLDKFAIFNLRAKSRNGFLPKLIFPAYSRSKLGSKIFKSPSKLSGYKLAEVTITFFKE